MIRALLILSLALGCSKDGAGSADADADTDIDTDTDDTADPEPEPPPLLNGLYSAGFAVGPVPGLVVPLQLEFEMSMDEDENRTVNKAILRAANGAGDVSDDLATITDPIAVDADGNLVVDWPLFVLPGPFSPTEGDVEIESVMTGVIQSESKVCGDVTGDIVSFDMDLAGSTFGTTRWDDRILGTPSACVDADPEPVARITDCPDMVPGRVTDFPSGGEQREYELHLPDGYDGSSPAPLAVVLHGINSSIDDILGNDNLLDEALRTGHIVIAPQSLELGGTPAWDPVGMPDYNLDVVLFDDLITCMTEQYTIDPDRIHVTGMSLGGIFTGTLIQARSNIIASAAPFSGGTFTSKSDGWDPIPTLVSWGGVEDTSHGQDFHDLASLMIDGLGEDGHFLISCDHGGGHSLRAELWPYTFQFFQDHPKGVDPLPYADAGLPELFPEYCFIVE